MWNLRARGCVTLACIFLEILSNKDELDRYSISGKYLGMHDVEKWVSEEFVLLVELVKRWWEQT
jgi:hypothetical protein